MKEERHTILRSSTADTIKTSESGILLSPGDHPDVLASRARPFLYTYYKS